MRSLIRIASQAAAVLALSFLIVSCIESYNEPPGTPEPPIAGIIGPRMEVQAGPQDSGEQTPAELHPLNPEREEVERGLPETRGGGTGWCTGPGEQPLDIASWVQAANDIIVGTLDGFTPVWEPLWRMRKRVRGFLDPSECLEGDPGLDLHLVDVESLLGSDVPTELTVRLGYGAFAMWRTQPRAEIASDVLQGWATGEPPIETGMRIGGALYQQSVIEAPVFLPNHEPLFEVLDGRVWFQPPPNWGECPMWLPWPDIGSLDGRELGEVASAVLAARSSESGTRADDYRSELRVDSPPDEEVGTYAYGALCRHRVDEEWSEHRPYECETDVDCWEGDICLRGACVPETVDSWEVPIGDGDDEPPVRDGSD